MDASNAVAGLGHNNPPGETEAQQSLVQSLARESADLLARVEKTRSEAKLLRDEINAITGGAKDILDVLNDDLVGKMVAIGLRAKDLSDELDNTRLARTKQLRDDVKTINDFFNTPKEFTDNINSAFAQKSGEYAEAKQLRDQREAAERARKAEETASSLLAEAEAASGTVLGDVLLNQAAKAEQESQMAAKSAVKAGTGPVRTSGGSISKSTKWAFEILDRDAIPLDAVRSWIPAAAIATAVGAYVRYHKDSKPLAGVRIFPETKTSFR